jgi:secondary thiamine-phosphate synthase enzyme
VERLDLRTTRRAEMLEITARVREVVRRSGVSEGVAVVQSLHTTAGLTVNENADPDVVHDVLARLDRLFPQDEPYFRHAEGNSDSHLKTSFMGTTATVLVSGGDLVLGRWQGIWFCEFDGPRERQVAVQVLSAAG